MVHQGGSESSVMMLQCVYVQYILLIHVPRMSYSHAQLAAMRRHSSAAAAATHSLLCLACNMSKQ